MRLVFSSNYIIPSGNGTPNQSGNDLFAFELTGAGTEVWTTQFGLAYPIFAGKLQLDGRKR